jgi:hypothetical protein
MYEIVFFFLGRSDSFTQRHVVLPQAEARRRRAGHVTSSAKTFKPGKTKY